MNPAIKKIMSQIADMSTARLAIMGLICAGIYYMSFFNDGSTLRQSIDGMKSQISEEETKKIETNSILQKEEQMRGDVSLLVKKYEEVKARIPIEFLESELRIIVDTLINKYELKTVKNLRANSGQDFGVNQDASLVEQVPLEYTFTGTFSKLYKFMKDLSLTEKTIKVENFILAATPRASNAPRSKELTLTATIIGFKQSSVAAGAQGVKR